MFEVGSLVSYATTGICELSEIKKETIGGKTREYFCLVPVSKSSGRILVPVDNQNLKEKMHSVPKVDELQDLLNKASELDLKWCENDAERAQIFSEVLESGNYKRIFELIGCLIKRRKELGESSKHLRAADNNVLNTAQRVLGSTFSLVFSISFEEALKKIESAFS